MRPPTGQQTADPVATGLRATLDRPAAVVLALVVVWGVWATGAIARGDVDRMPHVGRAFLEQGAGTSPTIDRLRPTDGEETGYDGQFNLFIALDPLHADAYIDEPPYRYGRILYPMLARTAALGRPGAIPWALFGLNLVAVLAGSYALAVLLRRRGASPWYALLFGLAPGLYVAVSRDLADPVAYALVAAALAVLGHDRRRLLGAALLFGLAGATREMTLLFPLALAAALALGLRDVRAEPRRRDVRSAALLAAVAVAPYALLRTGLRAWLGEWRTATEPRLELVPFRGILGDWPLGRTELEQLYSVVLPALVALVAVMIVLRHVGPLVSVLIANVVGLVVLLSASSYAEILASSRVSIGVVVAFLACLPLLPRDDRLLVAVVPAMFWLAPWYLFFPAAFGR